MKEQTDVLDLAMRLAGKTAATYRVANAHTRGRLNQALFEKLLVVGGKITEVRYQSPFERIFSDPTKFVYGGVERETGFEPVKAKIKTAVLYTNSAHRRAPKGTKTRPG